MLLEGNYPNGARLLCVPFDTVMTSVWLFQTNEGTLIIDSATTEKDVCDIILPWLKSENVDFNAPMTLLLSHSHGDHSGGAAALSSAFEKTEVYAADPLAKGLPNGVKAMRDGQIFFGFLEVLHVGGHCKDACAFFDRRDKTLYTCDSVQFFGVGKYGCGILHSASAYIRAIERFMALGARAVYASHEYFPCGISAEGEEATSRWLKNALLCLEELLSLSSAFSSRTAEECAENVTAILRKAKPQSPPFPPFTERTFRNENREELLFLCRKALRGC